MKLLTVSLILFSFNLSWAISFEVVGKNKEIILSQVVDADITKNIGQLSVDLFNQNKIPFQGSEFGISSLANLNQDIDVISDTEMKAYGWCFSIDDVISEAMPDQTWALKQDSKIIWFYGYAHYKKGDWIGQCLKD